MGCDEWRRATGLYVVGLLLDGEGKTAARMRSGPALKERPTRERLSLRRRPRRRQPSAFSSNAPSANSQHVTPHSTRGLEHGGESQRARHGRRELARTTPADVLRGTED